MDSHAKTHTVMILSCIAVTAACAVSSRPVQASDREVTVEVSVSTAGLDLSQPAVARKLYTQLQNAAYLACGSGKRVGLKPVDDVSGCCEKAVGDAVRSANLPQLTLAYLRTHTLQEAAAHGIPVVLAAK
jgi:UrcA family protein